MNAVVDGTFPGTGPYVVADGDRSEVRLARNPRFTIFDAAVRPDGFPNEIVFSVAGTADLSDEDVTRSASGWLSGARRTSPRTAGPADVARVVRSDQGPISGSVEGRLGATIFVSMNASVPPFDNVQVRQAVNYAIDRAQMADLSGGPPDAAITCQLLPPGWPGYQPYCPYTRSPDEGGRWSAPDITTAQQLIDASGTRGAEVVVGPAFGTFRASSTTSPRSSPSSATGYRSTTPPKRRRMFETWARAGRRFRSMAGSLISSPRAPS